MINFFMYNMHRNDYYNNNFLSSLSRKSSLLNKKVVTEKHAISYTLVNENIYIYFDFYYTEVSEKSNHYIKYTRTQQVM